jgi:uncharacterized protein YkwD
MVERVNTGGSKIFVYTGKGSKLSYKEKREIDKAYRLAAERKKVEELRFRKQNEREQKIQKERQEKYFVIEKGELQKERGIEEEKEGIIDKIIKWLNYRDYQSYDYGRILHVFLWSILIFLIAIGFFVFSLVNFGELNSILIWFIPLGWIILLISGFFVIKHTLRFIGEVPNWIKRQRRWVKLLLILILAMYIFLVYRTQDLGLGYSNSHSASNVMSTYETNISNMGFSLINDFRVKNNLPKFEQNLNAFNMALFLTNDYSNYFISEEEKANISSRFNVGGNVVILFGKLNNNSNYTINSIVSRWETLESWRVLLLNSTYKSGDLACYSEKCLMVLSTEYYRISNGSKVKAGQEIINWFESILSKISLKSNSSKQSENTDEKFGFGEFVDKIIDPKSQIDISTLEQEVHQLINVQRTNNGLSALTWDDSIGTIAREHSEDMVKRNFFSHINPSGEDPTDRASKQGYSCRKDYGAYYTDGLAENIAMTPIDSNVIGCGSTTSLESLANCIVNGWMTSPGHRQNILTSTYTKTGIGIAYSNNDEAYSTQDFC